MSKSVSVGGWTISTKKLPILNAAESEAAAAKLHLPLPEICFGNNELVIERESDGFRLRWNALEALQSVQQDAGVQVAHAAEWARGQAASGSAGVSVQKPFDWTYTTLYPGEYSVPRPAHTPYFKEAPASHPGIPLELLARQDIPILFFDEIPLFEDELGDNGISELVVRTRVNATSVFVLARFFLRIDHVLFRMHDVRLYHEFGSNEIIRERKARQESYLEVRGRLPVDKRDDLSPLTDVNWVASLLHDFYSKENDSRRPPRGVVPFQGLDLMEIVQTARIMEELDVDGGWEEEGTVLEVLELPTPST